ncbi:MAG: hypothetical protein N3A38_14370 [Planctomycetota bacterium]|nr:hypothetical protein [Planctomycetota bacterium]
MTLQGCPDRGAPARGPGVGPEGGAERQRNRGQERRAGAGTLDGPGIVIEDAPAMSGDLRGGGSERGARIAGWLRRAGGGVAVYGLLCAQPLLPPATNSAPAGEAPGASPAPAEQEPIVRLAPGDVLVYAFAQYSRHRSGAGNDQVSEERMAEGVLTFYVLDAVEGGGWRLAVLSDLEETFVRKAPDAAGPGGPVRGRRTDATIIRLTRDLRRAEGYEFGRAPAVGSSSREVPEGGAPPVPVPVLFPPLAVKDVSRTGPWEEDVEALAPFGGLSGGRAQHGVETDKNRTGTVSFVRAIEGEPTRYIEKFQVNVEARTLVACEFLHHTCGAGGNSRQETRAVEKSRRRLGGGELVPLVAAANEIEAAARLLREKPEEGRARLAKLRDGLRGSPFLPAVEAALGASPPRREAAGGGGAAE